MNRSSLFDLFDRMLAETAARQAAGLPEPWLAEAVWRSVPCHYGKGGRIVRHDPDGRRWEVSWAGPGHPRDRAGVAG